MKICGLWSGHDCSFAILENGMPIIHAEYERYNREKCTPGDSVKFFEDRYENASDITVYASAFPLSKLQKYEGSFSRLIENTQESNGNLYMFSHHRCHAANAFYSSNINDAITITMDGGGVESHEGAETACTIWHGKNNSMNLLKTFMPHEINIGGVWSRITRYVFKLQNGWPYGGQEGTIMAMAALGNSQKYHDDFFKMLTSDIIPAGMKPSDQPIGPTSDRDPRHPYLEPWAAIARVSEQDKFDLAAGLQSATEQVIRSIIKYAIGLSPETKNICLSGGVVLNSVAMGKIKEWFPNIEEVYIPPVPYDAGLSIGAAQIVWHEVMKNPRISWKDNFTPYLGERWTRDHFNSIIEDKPVNTQEATVEDVISLLEDGNIVCVFNEGSESGRRALGNRSILADPRNKDMKDIINKKVKHRQWFRPFAPSILQESGEEWFENYQHSPYMQFVLKFKKDKLEKVPAVVHFDGTARLQTVSKNDNSWYYGFLKKWEEKTGVPIILNTSFNDREPICENVDHAISCFLGTEIDFLFFPEYNVLISKKGEK